MNVSYLWLKDFVDVRESPRELAERLTMAGLEVKSIRETGGDSVFEIEITSNRPDWLSMLGVAREVCALTGAGLKLPDEPKTIPDRRGFPVSVEDSRDCPLYTATLIRDVHVGVSPEWLRKRLEAVGARPVNNVVDATNYVMFALGTPVHAFDCRVLNKTIRVRRAAEGERLVTIDGEERSLHAGALVIADAAGPVAVAGVIGGKESEVGASSKDILLEAAVFDPLAVRRTRQKLGLQTEASYRFERGVDRMSAEFASRYCGAMIASVCGGTVESRTIAGSWEAPLRTVSLSHDRVKKILDISIPPAESRTILSRLGFVPVGESPQALEVRIPSFRPDVSVEADLIEEVARIYGYERIPSRLPAWRPQGRIDVSAPLSDVRNTLAGLGLHEVTTYSLIDRQTVKAFGFDEAASLSLANPLNSEQEILQPGLIIGVAECIAHNYRQKQEWIPVFEIAHIFDGKAGERTSLCIGLSGSLSRWAGPGAPGCRYEAGFLHVKGILEVLSRKLAVTGLEFTWVQPGREAAIAAAGNPLGRAVRLSAPERALLDVKERNIFCAEIDLDRLVSLSAPCRTYAPLPRFPSITRDVTLELPESTGLKDVTALLKEGGRPLLAGVGLVDYYAGAQVAAGNKRITLSCRYSSNERTLTEEEILPLHEKAVDLVLRRFGAQLR